jgi:hypothetical protein
MRLKLLILLLFSIRCAADEFVDLLKKVYQININSLMIFTSQDMLSSGRYKFGDDVMHITNFPFIYHFKPYNRYFNFYVNGSAGYSKKDHPVDLNKVFGVEGLPDDYVKYDTYALKIGGGIHVTAGWDIEMLFGASIIYTHIKNRYDYNSPESETVLKPIFDNAFANQHNDNFSYELFMQYGYFPNFHDWRPFVLLEYHYFDTKSDFSIESLGNYKTQSSTAKLKAGVRTPDFATIYNVPLGAGMYTEGNALRGDLDTILGFSSYGAIGLSIYVGTKFYTDLIDEFSIEYSEIDGDGISGHNIGVGFDFAF